MTIIAGILMFIGFVIALIFGIKLLIIAFKESILWGIGFIIVPFVNIIFIAMHWNQCKSSFLKYLLSIPFFILGAILMPGVESSQ